MSDRIRLVVMGDSCVGKSAILRRFLFGEFLTKHVPTIEDLFSRDFELGEQAGGNGKPNVLKVDILDTAGDAQFPAMRRLSIASAHAFLLVYSITDALSFATVKERFEEIREQRADFQDIPIVIAGNKNDMVNELECGDVEDWVNSELPRQRSRLVECSARTNHNIREVFKTFLFLSKIAPNVSSSRTSSRRTSDEEAKLNGLSGNGQNGSGEKQFNFPRSDEIILTSSQQHTTTSRLSRWGSLKGRSSSPAINSSPKESPLRRNVSAYGRSGRFSRKAENENPNEAQVSRTRKKIHSGSKGNGIDPLEIHFEQDAHFEHSPHSSPGRNCALKPISPLSKLLSFKLGSTKSINKGSNSNNGQGSNGKSTISPNPSLIGPTSTHNNLLNKPGNNGLNVEEINTGGCGVDPAYSKGRKGKRSQSLIRRSSKKLKNQVPAISNTDDCIIS